jgi:signal transduction histidine kinase
MALPQSGGRGAPPNTNVSEGVFQPVWRGAELLLARRISLGGRDYVQGCWLDWPALHDWLIAMVPDLLPDAQLLPADSSAREGRLLAGLPLRLVVPAPRADADPVRPQVWVPLAVAWGCVLLAASAVAVLLLGTVALSERRAAFVSAVTHELRTPLTTFRLYTEMLADGLIRDESKRREYLVTLQAEALRLGHLVENVLTYARLERRSPAAGAQRISVAELIERCAGRLRDRTTQAGMELCFERSAGDPAPPDVDSENDPRAVAAGTGPWAATVCADPAVVEQILFNLVDNACKYAGRATDRRIHIRAHPASRGRIEIAVADHGPGLPPAEARRLFRPFQKSAHEAAHSAPGVGLGLALSRRLARAMRGDLRLQPHPAGACFVLRLPAG